MATLLQFLEPHVLPEDHAFVEKYDATVRTRGLVERAIVRRLVRELLAQGYAITVDYGDVDDTSGVTRSTDEKKIIDAVQACDEEWLQVYKNDRNYATIFLVYGNDGWDVISDYSVKLQDAIVKTNKFADDICTVINGA